MLVVDPLKRATIADIRSDPWFNSSLPAYLKPLPSILPVRSEPADEAVLTEVATMMSFKMDTVRYALSASENNQIKVAYQVYSMSSHHPAFGRL